jgi:peptidoglycan/LPS O-acetylase OafA/YrhL
MVEKTHHLSKRVDYIDLLRVLALGSVISFHYLFSGISKGKIDSLSPTPLYEVSKYGYLGVELFFLISGFVILYSTNRTPVEFIKRRFLRLYPMFWIAIIFIFLVTNLPFWEKSGPDLDKALLNLTMIPTAFGGEWVDRAHWFLLRELQFYLFIVIMLFLGLGKKLPQIFPVWAIILCFWNLLNLPHFEIWYFSGYFALISGGAIIYCVREWGWTRIRAIGLLASYICAVDTRMATVNWLNSHRNTQYSALVIGAIITFLYLLLLLTLNKRVSSINLKWAGLAGAITYPLFLIHGRVGGVLLQNLGTDSNKYFIYPAVLIVLIYCAYLALKIEKKVLNLRPFRALAR